MDIVQAIILGIVQGATEFIPISSSGHLILIPWWFNWPVPSLELNVIIQLGTLLAVLIYFWRDWLRVLGGGLNLLRTRRLDDPDSRLFVFLVIGSIPAGVAGLLLKDFFDQVFQNAPMAAFFLLVTAGLLILSEHSGKPARTMAEMTWQDAILIGVGQMAALFPGVSRSGSTIAAGLLRGIKREDAARFSFLLGTPAFLGAGLLSVLDLIAEGNFSSQLPLLVGGFVSAAVVGYLTIAFLLAYLRQRRLYIFAVYCAAFGLISLLAALLGR